MSLTKLSDDELVSRIATLCLDAHRLTARLLVHLIEVEERRLHLRAACTSMFDFCIRKLGMSECVAFRRIAGARLVREFPRLLSFIERGELCLSTLIVLRPHLSHANLDELVAAVRSKTQRQIKEHLARIAPKPDVPSLIEPLSQPAIQTAMVAGGGASASASGPLTFIPQPAPPSPSSRIEPLSEVRFKVQVTASIELRDKLERARDLMRHRNPSGELATVLEAAVDALLEKLEKERLGKATRARRTARPTKPGRVPRAVRREVFERDGEQCTFEDELGERCPARGFLELDHVEPRALGGADDARNLRVRCRAHNGLYAEQVFGKAHVANAMDFRQRKSQRGGAGNGPESEDIERAVIGLAGMGFSKLDARRALRAVSERRVGDESSVQLPDLIREAIRLLT